MSARTHANAHRSGIIPRRSVSPSAVSATRREPSRSPAQHNAAARMTSDFTACRAEPNAAASSTGRSAWATAGGPHPGPSRVQRTPTPSAPEPRGAEPVDQLPGAASAAPDAANRPTPSASAASPMRASTPASSSEPASAHARPSHGRARSCQPSWRRNDARVLCASDATGPRRAASTAGQIGQRAAVAALSPGRDGAQPQFVRRRRGGQRPASAGRRRTRRSEHDVLRRRRYHRSTLSTAGNPVPAGALSRHRRNLYWLTVCGGQVNSMSTAYWSHENRQHDIDRADQRKHES